MPILGVIASSLLRIITDNFNRTTSGGLGTSSSGTVWNGLRGIWFANGSQAVSNDAASTYPIASVPFRSNATVSSTVSGGVGVSYWINDSNNWWASYPNYIQNSFTSSVCNAGYTTQTTTSGFCAGYTTNPGTCSVGDFCTGVGCNVGVNTGKTACNTVTYTTNNQYCPGNVYCASGSNGPGCYVIGSSCSAYVGPAGSLTTGTFDVLSDTTYSGFTAYTTTTTYTYDTQIKVISSVSGSVVTQSTTNLVTGAGSLSTVGSLKAVTSGNQITTTAYSGTDLTSQLGSPVVSTPSSPSTGASVGIIKSPSTYLQGTTLDNFSAS